MIELSHDSLVIRFPEVERALEEIGRRWLYNRIDQWQLRDLARYLDRDQLFAERFAKLIEPVTASVDFQRTLRIPDDGKPYPYVRADAANNDFVATFEEFLREVWIGMTYVNAASSANPTDPAKIALLAERLHDMFRSRRQNGNLSREELTHVSAMSWFHFTLEFNSPILLSLRADATGTEQRLFKVAERVGLPAHGLAKHFFEIADPLSRILIQIETGEFNTVAAVPALYTPDTTEPESPEAAMRQIILNWTAIRGVDVKSRKVTATA